MAFTNGSIVMIFMNVALALGIVFIILIALSYQRSFNTCEANPSDLCYQVQCPCDDSTTGPCFGMAYRDLGNGRYVCINSPLTVVNSQGNPV